jgi:hypothetical protein
LLLAVSLAPASTAAAHLGHIVLNAERYLKLDATDADTRLVVSLTLGATEGRRVLEAADADHDGEVSQAEADAYLAEWGRGLRDELPIEVDGERVDVPFTEPFLDPIGRVADVPVTVEMVAHIPVSTREARIVVRDQMVRRDTYDRTEIAFRAHDGAEVVRAGGLSEPTARELDLACGRTTGVPMPDVLTMDVVFSNRSEPTSPWAYGVPAALAAAIVSLGVARARRRPS